MIGIRAHILAEKERRPSLDVTIQLSGIPLSTDRSWIVVWRLEGSCMLQGAGGLEQEEKPSSSATKREGRSAGRLKTNDPGRTDYQERIRVFTPRVRMTIRNGLPSGFAFRQMRLGPLRREWHNTSLSCRGKGGSPRTESFPSGFNDQPLPTQSMKTLTPPALREMKYRVYLPLTRRMLFCMKPVWQQYEAALSNSPHTKPYRLRTTLQVERLRVTRMALERRETVPGPGCRRRRICSVQPGPEPTKVLGRGSSCDGPHARRHARGTTTNRLPFGYFLRKDSSLGGKGKEESLVTCGDERT